MKDSHPIPDKKVEVLIVGAGFTGLLMAAQLLRHGLYPTIIDKKLGSDRNDTTVLLHARTIELFHQLGLGEHIRQASRTQTELEIFGGAASLDLRLLEEPGTLFPCVWGIPATKLEQLLINHLTSNACKIHWGTQLTTLIETTSTVSVEIQRSSDRLSRAASPVEAWKADWVIGADGRDSRVRAGLGLGAEQARAAMVSRLASRRCFLIGDAARPGLSGTAQGLNIGFRDTWNLSWKLAGAVSGRIDRSILFSYHDERIVSDSGGRGDRTVRALRATGKLHLKAPRLAGKVLPLLLNWIHGEPARLTRAFRAAAGLSAHYRNSPLSVHYSMSERIRAGDRFPWHELYDEKTGTQTDTRRIFDRPGFVLVILGNAGGHMLQVLGQWIKQKYPQGMGLYYIPYSARNHAIFVHFGMSPDSVQAVLVRPDTYIAYITDAVNTFLIDNYMETIIGWKLFRRFE